MAKIICVPFDATPVEFDPGPDYRGRMFDRFYAATSPGYGPGWYVYGRNPEYGSMLTKRCAQPDVKPRKHLHYNVRIRRGWHTRREAEAVAKFLNEMEKEPA